MTIKGYLLSILIIFSYVEITTAQIGGLDSSFGTYGILIPNQGLFEGRIEGTKSLKIQTDNKILVAGTSFNNGMAMFRTLPDGEPDLAFNAKGHILTDYNKSIIVCRALAIQGDGKIVSSAYGKTISVLRHNPDGSLDNSFGNGGIVTTDISGSIYLYDDIYTIAIQDDGKIVVAGNSGDGYDSDIFLIRYNINGELDTTFGKTGIIITKISKYEEVVRGLAIQPDGKIIVAGSSEIKNTYNSDIIMLRYNTNGELDKTFNSKGYFLTHIAGYQDNYCSTLQLQADNKILLAGQGVLRLNADGTLDSSFGNSGIVSNSDDWGAWISGIDIQPDNKILACGWYHKNGMDNDIIIYRYNQDGSPDTTFGISGSSKLDLGSYNDMAMSCSIQGNKLIVAGNSGDTKIVLLRLNLDTVKNIVKPPILYKQSPEISSYPNPAINSKLTLEYNLPHTELININILNHNGKLIKKIIASELRNAGNNKEEITLPDNFLPGTFIMAIEGNNYKTYTKIVIIH